MPIKQVFESAPAVYRTGLRSGLTDPWAGTADQSRIFDEYLWQDVPWGGLFVIENLDSPTDYKIVFFALNVERSSGVMEGANFVALQWSGLTGEFLGHDDRLGFQVSKFVTGARGTIRATSSWIIANHITYKLDPYAMALTEEHPAGYYSGHNGLLLAVPCVNEQADLALMINSSDHHDLREIAVHRESTGEFLYKFRVCGVPESIFMADDDHAYTVANDGTLTLFNYVTGKIIGVLHVGLSDYIRHWAWDRIAKRILCFELTPDVMPEGHCTARVTGYYPVPVPHGLAGPIPLQAPAVGRRVEWVSKVYGAAGEGIPGMLVSYSLESALGATLSPAQHTTDLNGNSRTFVTSSLAGDNSITASVEV